MTGPKSPVQDANDRVGYAQACALTGMPAPRDRGARAACPGCGEDGYKSYAATDTRPAHGYCHACGRWFTAVKLAAAVNDMTQGDAAAWLLGELGLPPLDAAERWERALHPPVKLGTEDLADALRTWCAAQPGWEEPLPDPRVSKALSACLRLIPAIITEEQCEQWYERCTQVMGRVLAGMT